MLSVFSSPAFGRGICQHAVLQHCSDHRRVQSAVQYGNRSKHSIRAMHFNNSSSRRLLPGFVLRNTRIQALPDPDDQAMEAIDARARVRSEVLAPFRVVRLVLYGFFAVSASVGGVIATAQLVGALGKAPNALPLEGILQGLAIDAGAILTFVLLFRSDWAARKKQIARLTREERLGSLKLELSNRKTMRLGQLRKFARPVLVAGTPEQVEAAVAAAEPLRQQLEERGVLIIPLPVFTSDGDASSQSATSAALTDDDLRFKATALRQGDWKAWFQQQMELANARPEKGLYVSLRLDGRVRASGTGSPPWHRFANELPPVKGAWSGILDGMDGKV